MLRSSRRSNRQSSYQEYEEDEHEPGFDPEEREEMEEEQELVDSDDDGDGDKKTPQKAAAKRSKSTLRERSSNSRSGRKRKSPEAVTSQHTAKEEEEEENGSADNNAEANKQWFSSQMPEESQDIAPAMASHRNNLNKLGNEAREKALKDLCTLVLFKGLAGEPIVKNVVIKEVGISDAKITTAAFEEVNERLQAIFGFKLVATPAWMTKMKDLPSKFKGSLVRFGSVRFIATPEAKWVLILFISPLLLLILFLSVLTHIEAERYYLINVIEDEDGTHIRPLHATSEQGVLEKGLLMLVLGFIYCKGHSRSDGSRWILDKDLYALLHKVDEDLPSEPPIPGAPKRKMPGTSSSSSLSSATPDVDAMLSQFVHMDYLLQIKASANEQLSQMNDQAEDNSFFYSMGPRACLEVGRSQVIHFCAEVLEVEPEQSMLDELENEVMEEMDQVS